MAPGRLNVGCGVPALGPEAFALLDCLDREELEGPEVSGALEEFALRCLLKGTRAREWCEDLRQVLGLVRDTRICRKLCVALQA
jgi:hypothetical protein